MILYNPTVSGSLVVTGSLTTTGTITSQTLVVQTITSSIEFNTGSTRNGTLSTNTHEFTGSVLVSGSVGIGVTPSAWGGGSQVFENSTFASSIYGYTRNAYFNGTSWIYVANSFATRYTQFDSQHLWYNAPSGTAGNVITFTQAMTLDSNGRLSIGNTSVSALNERLNVTGNGIGIEDADGGRTMLLGHFGGVDGILGTFTNDALQIRINNVARLTLAASTGAATFSSSVTANNFIASGGDNTFVLNAGIATTGWQQIAMTNTSGSTLLGVEGSAAGTLATGTTAYASILRNYTNTALQFATNNIVRATITSAGVLDLTSGQLKFPSSQNASSDANTLDDYEEGTWTPTIASGGFSISSISLANYTKIGRVVQCIADFTLSGTGTSSALYIGGLPFTNLLNGWSASAAYFQFVNIDNKQLVAVVMSGATTIQFTLSPASNVGGNTRAANGNDFSAGYMNVNVTYFV